MGSGRAGFDKLTAAYRSVTLDTCSCIYFLGKEPARGPLVYSIIRRAAADTLAIHLPGIVRLELLVHPMQTADLLEMESVQSFINEQAGISKLPISDAVIDAAAAIRAMTRLKTPDALVVASAIVSGSEAVVGNDARFEVMNAVGDVKLFIAGSRPRAMPRYVHLDNFVEKEPDPRRATG